MRPILVIAYWFKSRKNSKRKEHKHQHKCKWHIPNKSQIPLVVPFSRIATPIIGSESLAETTVPLTRVCAIAEVQQKTTNASKNKTFVFISIELVIFNELISIRFVM